MGANLTYIAIKGKTPGEICEELSLARSGEWNSSDGYRGGIAGGTSYTDWYVVVDRHDDVIRAKSF